MTLLGALRSGSGSGVGVLLCVAGCIAPDSHVVQDPPAPFISAADAAVPQGASELDAGNGATTLPKPGDFGVRAEARPARICPGQCSLLSAEVSGGSPPTKLAWQGPDVEGKGPWTVCPHTTTSYLVSAEDTGSTDVEFPSAARHAESRVTVEVRESCAGDAGPEPSVDAGPEHAPTECTIRIPISPYGGVADVKGRASADAAGNVYVALEFVGELSLGQSPLVSVPGNASRLLLAKYDAHCSLQWQRWIGMPEEVETLAGMRVNGAGKIALLHSHFVRTQMREPDYRRQLLVLDPDGAPVWTLEVRGSPVPAEPQSLMWGRDGSLAVTWLDELCGGDSSRACVTKVDARGKVVFARGIGGVWTESVALDAEGGLLVAGFIAGGKLDVPGLASPVLSGLSVYLAKFDADGVSRWAVATPVVEQQATYEDVGFLGELGDGSLLAAWRPPAEGITVARWTLEKSGAQRALSKVAPAPVGSAAGFPVFTANERGELFTAMPIDSALQTRVSHWRADGSLVAQRDLPESKQTYPSSFQISPQGALLLTSAEQWTMQTGTALVVRVLTGP